eukprot:CAMPEP_0204913842 /NCGR_PEP_ID=MMETSP1397-20131031/11702_1 /ASSEMBLY_ACC=CAM_ASM_000891 /TAXON_ID=49980 /ORGANISM="Climacostomum Climacostomum virens, Strain Stock W-24" /LENGTH=60 /DNA_ID=CAMNT_0052085173 /DNA_START=14 /DNA_END=193 /DNA_ORIENTATION=+
MTSHTLKLYNVTVSNNSSPNSLIDLTIMNEGTLDIESSTFESNTAQVVFYLPRKHILPPT